MRDVRQRFFRREVQLDVVDATGDPGGGGFLRGHLASLDREVVVLAWIEVLELVDAIDDVHESALERGLAQGWKKQAADSGTGWKLVDANGIERLRFMRGKGEGEKVRWERMKNGYMRWKDAKGNDLDANGSAVPKSDPDFDEKTHIAYEGS